VKAAAIFGRAKAFYVGCSFSLLSTASKPSGACHPMWQSGLRCKIEHKSSRKAGKSSAISTFMGASTKLPIPRSGGEPVEARWMRQITDRARYLCTGF